MAGLRGPEPLPSHLEPGDHAQAGPHRRSLKGIIQENSLETFLKMCVTLQATSSTFLDQMLKNKNKAKYLFNDMERMGKFYKVRSYKPGNICSYPLLYLSSYPLNIFLRFLKCF